MMLQLGDFGTDLRADAKLFLEFALQGLRRVFAGLDFSAGKLPLQRQRLIFRPLAAEDFFASEHQRGDHLLDHETCTPLGSPRPGVMWFSPDRRRPAERNVPQA